MQLLLACGQDRDGRCRECMGTFVSVLTAHDGDVTSLGRPPMPLEMEHLSDTPNNNFVNFS